MSAKLVFIIFRQQTVTIQGVLQSSKPKEKAALENIEAETGLVPTPNVVEVVHEENEPIVSEKMVRSIEHNPSETIVVVTARVRKALQTVKNATIHDQELDVLEIHRVTQLSEHVPFTVYDAENINRDKEDPEDDDIGADDASHHTAESAPLSPAPISPTSATPNGTTPQFGSPRASTELGRISVDKLASRSKLQNVCDEITRLTMSRQLGRQDSKISPTTRASQQQNCRPTYLASSGNLPHSSWYLQLVPKLSRYPWIPRDPHSQTSGWSFGIRIVCLQG